jgi:phosphate/sulfate permease
MGNLASVPVGWVIVPASIIAAGATYAVGANDAANALGTSVGARSLSLRSAIALGAVMEFLGIVALGAVVGSTLRSGIIDPFAFTDPRYYVVGMFSVLCAAFSWLLVATLLGLPVSTTHTIVAGIASFGLFEVGTAALNVNSVVIISISWIVSPLLGFAVALVLYLVLNWVIVRRHELTSDAAGIRRWVDWLFPVCAAGTLGFMTVTVLLAIHKSTKSVPLPVMVVLPVVIAAIAGVLTWFVLLPYWYNHKDSCAPLAARFLNWGDAEVIEGPLTVPPVEETTEDQEQTSESALIVAATATQIESAIFEARQLFTSLMVATAAIVAFSHAANDISNSVAPLLVWYAFCLCVDSFLSCNLCSYEWVTVQSLDPEFRGPFWLYIIAGVFLVLGLATLGFIVMRTIGEKVTKLNPMAGFVAQLSASIVIIICTVFGLPISTTHCVVGAVFGIGVASRQGVQWKMLVRIVLGWLVTIIIGAGLTLVFYAPLRLTIAPNVTTANSTAVL